MHLSFLSLALFSTLGFSSIIPAREANGGNPALTWHVSNFTTGCSPGGCVYDFNIRGVETDNTPGFDTKCSGNDEQDGYKPCDNRHVRAQMNPHTYPEWNIKVKHVWTDEVGEYMTIGEANVTAPSPAFEMKVTQNYGVGAD